MSVLASDSFNRADVNPLSSPWGGPSIAGDGAFKLVSNAATPVSLVDDCREWYDGGITWPNDQYSQGQLTVTGTGGSGQGVGLSLRNATGTKTCYRFVIDHNGSSNWEIGLLNAGAFTSLATGLQSFTDGDTFKMLVVGNSITVSKNGAAAFASASDGTLASGKPGLAYSSIETSLSVDVWEGGDNTGIISDICHLMNLW